MTILDETANPVDVFVGIKLRNLRLERGMSQEALATSLAKVMRRSYSFQQIQKYERGANRISASTLYYLGQVLKVPVSAFFDETANYLTSDLPNDVGTWAASAPGIAWIRAGYHLPKSVFSSMLETVRAIGRVQ